MREPKLIPNELLPHLKRAVALLGKTIFFDNGAPNNGSLEDYISAVDLYDLFDLADVGAVLLAQTEGLETELVGFKDHSWSILYGDLGEAYATHEIAPELARCISDKPVTTSLTAQAILDEFGDENVVVVYLAALMAVGVNVSFGTLHDKVLFHSAYGKKVAEDHINQEWWK